MRFWKMIFYRSAAWFLLNICLLSGFFLCGNQVLETRGTAEKSFQKETKAKSLDSDSPDIKKIALTFDDGPHPVYTKELLDGLKERNVKVTFFLIGAQIKENASLVRRMYQEGHLIGNHTYDHIQLNQTKESEDIHQITQTNEEIYKVTGHFPEFIRPPFGEWKENLEKKVQMLPVMWNLDTLDWKIKNTDAIVAKVLKNVKENDIILMHDYYQTSVEAAFKIIDCLKKEYTFVTAEELIWS